MGKRHDLPSGHNVGDARMLRRRLTRSERLLWAELRSRRFEAVKFRRQHPIENFVVDFYSYEANLIVEIDGGVHRTNSARDADASRQAFLEGSGYRVLRIDAELVEDDLEAAMAVIAAALTPGPSPNGTGE
jgi:very-short-patch-repair endonuclease